jgi:hypothetical protein
MPTIKTREEWLVKGVSALRPIFKKHGSSIPTKIMVGCGWPRGGKSEIIGQCFGKTWTTDETTHIFISPTQADEVGVLAVLAHELAHAAVGCEHGHRGEFKKVARAIGLEGKLTATFVSDKSPLYLELKKIAAKLGKYPHSKMLPKKSVSGGGTGGGGWIRLVSKTINTYTLTISPKSIEAYGYPMDPNGKPMVEKAA